jgi:hypothetical protein
MFTTSKEYLAYLQETLRQVDVDEFLRRENYEKFQELLETTAQKNLERRAQFQNVESKYSSMRKEHVYDEDFLEYAKSRYGLAPDRIAEDERIKNGSMAIDALVDNILVKLDPQTKQELKNISVGGLSRMDPTGLIFRSGDHIAILISNALLLLLWNNICFLEATVNPGRVLETDVDEGFKLLSSQDYAEIHNQYLSMVADFNVVEGVVFRFDKYSAYIVYQHAEIVFAFVLLHEFAHVRNGDLDAMPNYRSSKQAEFQADLTAIRMLEHYLKKTECPLTELDLVNMVEYYFFRLLKYCRKISDSHPTPCERVINLYSHLCKQGFISVIELTKYVAHFLRIYHQG